MNDVFPCSSDAKDIPRRCTSGYRPVETIEIEKISQHVYGLSFNVRAD
jgi:hypothetical protein